MFTVVIGVGNVVTSRIFEAGATHGIVFGAIGVIETVKGFRVFGGVDLVVIGNFRDLGVPATKGVIELRARVKARRIELETVVVRFIADLDIFAIEHFAIRVLEGDEILGDGINHEHGMEIGVGLNVGELFVPIAKDVVMIGIAWAFWPRGRVSRRATFNDFLRLKDGILVAQETDLISGFFAGRARGRRGAR